MRDLTNTQILCQFADVERNLRETCKEKSKWPEIDSNVWLSVSGITNRQIAPRVSEDKLARTIKHINFKK